MKKFSFLSSVFLLAVVLVFLIMGCQKESAAAEENDLTNNKISSESATVKGVSGNIAVTGLINPAHAQEMSDAFANKYPRVITKSVGYSTKNLIAYLTMLSTKYKMDSVYVAYGLYDKETAPKSSYVGRATIFFMGDKSFKFSAGSGSVATNDASSVETESNYLNGGQLFPPPNE